MRSAKSEKKTSLNSGLNIRLFYPATPLSYKNHKFLFDLLNYIKKFDTTLFSRIILNLTISKEDLSNLKLMDSYQNIEEAVILNGYIDQSKVYNLYRESDMLVFPSLIETLGLPLLEASEFGINILAINLEYAKEALTGYKNVVFLDCNDPQKWVESIKCFVPTEGDRDQFVTKGDFTSWKSIFDYFNELISRYE
jgi:glycosyltransferase involved in cell wall biosynthesis